MENCKKKIITVWTWTSRWGLGSRPPTGTLRGEKYISERRGLKGPTKTKRGIASKV